MKKILIINANQKKDSFSAELSQSYFNGAKQTGAEVELIHLIDLDFELILQDGFKSNQELESDLIAIQDLIKNADHLVFVFPNWWGTYPTLLKGFIDRVFLPGFAFQHKEKSALPEKLLKNKTARLIITMDTPKWYYFLFYKAPGVNSMKRCVFHYCGIKPVKTTIFTPIKKSTEEQRKKWLKVVKQLGIQLK